MLRMKRLPKMQPIYWLLVAIGFGAAGLIEGWFVVSFYLPLAASKSLVMYYPTEDRIGVHWAGVDECDHDYSPTYSIPLDPPLSPKRIAAKMLQICEKRGLEGDWSKSEKREPREVLDRIEELALNRDREIIGGLGMLTAVPVIFCLAAGALAIRKQA